MIVSWIFYYVFVWSILWKPAKFLAQFSNRAFALQFWETLMWTAWLGQAITFTLVGRVDFDTTERRILGDDGFEWMKRFYQHPATVVFAVLLIVTGTLVKSYAFYLSGINNLYCYDMILNKPNARFVDSKLYKLFSSPTYHVGYIDGYGVALFSGFFLTGSPMLMLIYVGASHFGICAVNTLVEQKFVKKMYLTDKE